MYNLKKISKLLSQKPSFLMLDDTEFKSKIDKLRKMLTSCKLCPNECGVNRFNNELGRCGQSAHAAVSHYLPHFGEEPLISGTNGAGTVFFYGCTMKCAFCQNFQISQKAANKPTVTPEVLAEYFLKLQAHKCHNIDLVTPTPHIAAILEALLLAKQEGLSIPIVYNTNGYISQSALEILDCLVDIYLVDLKYASENFAEQFSESKKYVETSREAAIEMNRQQPKLIIDGSVAKKGCIIRILLMPNKIEEAEKTLNFLAGNNFNNVAISLMTQYTPLYKANEFPELRGGISNQRLQEIIAYAKKLGFDTIFYQDAESQKTYIPDFTQAQPFK